MPDMTPVDHKVKHTSTIPANAGIDIELFVREYKAAGSGGPPKLVLMLHGRSVPALPGFDLVLPPPGSSSHPDTSYSWAQAPGGQGLRHVHHGPPGIRALPPTEDGRPVQRQPCPTGPLGDQSRYGDLLRDSDLRAPTGQLPERRGRAGHRR